MTMAGMRRCLASVLLGAVASACPLAQGAVEELTVTAPKPFGYVIGDPIEHRVSLVLRPGFELDPASIPEPGRTNRWLWLNEAVLESEPRGGRSHHVIRLLYQVVNASHTVIGVGTPPVSLRILGPGGDLPVIVPAWGFTIGPIVEPRERPPGSLPDLRPSLPPAPFPTTGRTARVVALGLLAAGLLMLVAKRLLHGRPGWFGAGPFHDAYRRIERRMRNAAAPGAYADALIDVHAAFNATAGRVVFEHDLSRFFIEHPRFEPLRTPIEALFADSGKLFYGNGEGSAPGGQGLDRLHDLCRACRGVERRRRTSSK